MTEQKTTLDFEALRRTGEQNGVELLASFYADAAEGERRQDFPPGERRGLGRIAGNRVQGGKTMRGSRKDLPVAIEADEAIIQEAEWADIHVGFETYHEDFDIAPLLKGLPNDMCQCPHYGYVLKGRMRVKYAGREEAVNAGDAYYIPPGHAPIMEAGTEIVEFSPTEEYQKTMEVAERNFAVMQEEGH